MVRKLLIAVLLLGSGFAWAGPTILVFGDSLSSAYGILQKDGWAELLQQRLRQKRLDYTVVNASISGETTSGGASRIAPVLEKHRPAVVIVELGANDGLRGLPIGQMRDNLGAIAGAARRSGSRVLVVGMKLPPNYGPEYTREFERAYGLVARQQRCALLPFLFEGFAEKRELFQDDNLHPTAAAQPMLLENIWRVLAPLLK